MQIKTFYHGPNRDYSNIKSIEDFLEDSDEEIDP